MASSSKADYKVVLLGEGRVGKTSIISRYLDDTFDPKEASTVRAAMFSTKLVPVQLPGGSRSGGGGDAPLHTMVPLSIWDTAGQERFHALAPLYYRGAAGAMVVYDVTDRDTLSRASVWIKELRATAGDDIKLILCGNKTDLAAEVPAGEAERLAKELAAPHFHTSARTGEGVAEAFAALAAAVAAGDVRRGGVGSSCNPGGSSSTPHKTADEPGNSRRRRPLVVADGEEGAVSSAVRPPRPRAPVTLADMSSRTGDANGTDSGGGGGCC